MEQSNTNINFFRPVGEFMTKDVQVKKLVLVIWFIGTFGVLFALSFFSDPSDTVQITLSTGEVVQQLTGKSFLTEMKFMGFPFHYWYSAQFTLLLFIGLCYAYCKFIDKLESKFL